MNYVKEYIEKLKSKVIITSKKVYTFYTKVIEPIINDENSNYYFDEEKGEKFIIFAEKFCKQSTGKWAGVLTKLLLFQKAKYQAIFGIFHRETDKRRFKEIFDIRGRKNGKSTENAILALYLLLEEKGAEIYAAATVASQAKRVWEESKKMIDQDIRLRKKFKYKVFPSPTIYTTNKMLPSIYKILSKNVSNFDGLNASGAIIDEVHELKRAIYDILKQSTSAREKALLSMISTAGFIREAMFDDMYKYSSDVINGLIEDDNLFPLIYELDSKEEIENESCWVKANPAIDVIKNREDLVYNVKRMKTDLNFANTVKIKDFNIIGVANSSWLSYDVINNEIIYSEQDLKKFDNSIVVGGFDLSRTRDITAFATLLFDKEKNKIVALTMYWITANFLHLEETQSSKIPWRSWIDRGLIRISGADMIDYHDVANYVIANFQQRGWMYGFINYDSYSANYLIEELAQFGYSKGYCLKSVIQGFKSLSIPMQTVASHLESKTLCYQNNPVTKWMFTNVELVEDRNGNWMPKKAGNKNSRKIDGVATILNCYASVCENIDYYLKN